MFTDCNAHTSLALYSPLKKAKAVKKCKPKKYPSQRWRYQVTMSVKAVHNRTQKTWSRRSCHSQFLPWWKCNEAESPSNIKMVREKSWPASDFLFLFNFECKHLKNSLVKHSRRINRLFVFEFHSAHTLRGWFSNPNNYFSIILLNIWGSTLNR